MSLYTSAITIYAVAVTIVLCLQTSRTHRKLLDAMVASGLCETTSDLAHAANCTRLGAWVFLLALRARRCVQAVPLREGLVMNVYGYKLNSKGWAMFAPDTA